MLKNPSLDRFIEGKREGFYSLCVTLKAALLGSNEEWIHRIAIVFPSLDLTAGPFVPLFSKVSIFGIVEEIFFTYFITVLMSSAANSIGAVMIVVDEIAFGPGKFEVSAVLTQDGKFSSAVCSKASVIVCKGGL